MSQSSKIIVIMAVSLVMALVARITHAETGAGAVGQEGVKQSRMGGVDEPERRLQLMTHNLGLSGEQQEKIKPILSEEYEVLKKLTVDKSLTREQRRARLVELNQGTMEKIKGILTPEQQIKQDEIKKKIIEERANPRSTKPARRTAEFSPEQQLKRMTSYLGLTTEQQEKIKPILNEEFVELKKLRESVKDNQEQKRARLLELEKGTGEKIRALLTTEQQKKFDENRQKIAERRVQKQKQPPVGQEQK